MKKINTVWFLFQPRQFAGVEKKVEKRGKFRAVRAAALVETKLRLVNQKRKVKREQYYKNEILEFTSCIL